MVKKTEQLKQEYSEAEKFFVLSGVTNGQYLERHELLERIEQQDQKFDKFLDLFIKHLENKITKKEAVKEVTRIIHRNVRILTDREVVEEKLGKPVPDHEWELIIARYNGDIDKFIKEQIETNNNNNGS